MGFRPADVKILLHSHEHIDHVGGIGRLQQLTGAQLYASPAAAKVFETGTAGVGDPQAGMHKPFPSARVDHVIGDGGIVRLGDLYLTAIATPGHTPGALSWHWGACDVRRLPARSSTPTACRRSAATITVFPITRPISPRIARSIGKLRKIDCEILITPHPSASKMIDRMAGRAPLIDPNGCKAYAEALDKRLDERLAKEAAK